MVILDHVVDAAEGVGGQQGKEGVFSLLGIRITLEDAGFLGVLFGVFVGRFDCLDRAATLDIAPTEGFELPHIVRHTSCRSTSDAAQVACEAGVVAPENV